MTYLAPAGRLGNRVWALAIALLVGATSIAFAPKPAQAADLDPAYIISNDNMRHVGSMSQKEIQAFLETQTGPLKSLVAKDYAGVKRPASEIIYRACRAWSISPKVILTMLQKEQSLLTRTTLADKTLARAMGAGVYDHDGDGDVDDLWPRFGLQIWHGARLLDAYGEGKVQTVGSTTYRSTIPLFYKGILVRIYKPPVTGSWLVTKKVNGSTRYYIGLKNLATYKLYIYNPSYSGNRNFWLIYNKYFGNPFASPRWQPVYKFRKRSNGSYLYTTSIAEKVKLRTTSRAKYWVYVGRAFSVDNSATADTVPLYRFKNKLTGKYSFTTSTKAYRERRNTTGRKTWSYQGVAFRVSKKDVSGAAPVRRYTNRSTGGRLFSASSDLYKRYKSDSSFRSRWRYDGVVFYLPRR